MMKENPDNKSENQNRREFMKTGAVLGVGAAVLGAKIMACEEKPRQLTTKPGVPTVAPIKNVRVGFVGVGNQGSSHVRNFLNIEGVEIKAICDIIPEKVERMQSWVTEAGNKKPTGYSKGDYDFVRMCEEEELDLVFTATPWKWHVPICVSAMKNGKHAATEVPAAVTIEECWELVETAEKFQKHCVMMENCNYDRREMLFLNLTRLGMLGELIHSECGYLHDLRNYKVGDLYEGQWRIKHSIDRDGNLYPTHGLGPVAQCMNINRGNQFDYLVSMSSQSRGLNLYAEEKLGPDHPFAKQKYALGDVNVSLIKNHDGSTITVYHDTNLPRPYSRINIVQGTKGIAEGYPDRIHIEGRSPAHEWEDLESYYKEFEHPMWKNLAEKASGAGHGGMDYIEDYRVIRSLQTGTPMDMDVYDAAALSCIAEVSEKSVANKSAPEKIPDFTRGLWKTIEPLGIIDG
jgi:predicted dehydrogenase